jgi:hypothetical protein
MAMHPEPTERDPVRPRQPLGTATAFAGPPASVWVAALASIGLIVGGIAPWATAFGYLSFAGTSMHGWRAVMVGVAGLAMLVLHLLRGGRLPLIVASVAGVLAALLAILTLSKIQSDGAVTVLGQQYHYVDPAWGLYLVLVGAIALVCSTCALAWRASRAAG